MTGLSERRQVTVWLTEAIKAGARQDRACAVLGLSTRTVQRWQADEIVRSDRVAGQGHVLGGGRCRPASSANGSGSIY